MREPLVFLSAVLGLGIAAQWLAWRLRLPSILLLLAFGFLVGWLCGDDPSLAGKTITDEILTTDLLFPIVALAVSVIMFEGGLTLRFRDLEDSGSVLLRLVTLGALVTWGLAGLAAYLFVGVDYRTATLIGAILIVTGPTVITPLLRHVRPHRRIGSVIKWEGIVIDPIGAVLAVLVFDAMVVGKSDEVVWVLLKILLVGIGLGLGVAFALVQLMRRYWIPDFLHNSVFLAAAVGAFALSNQIAHEAGLVTVTILGIALANQKTIPVNHVVEFKENLRVLLISCLFIVLAARIQFTDIVELGWGGLAFVAALILVVRPLAALVSTWRSELTWNERCFLAFLAPRGIVAAAVSSVFALEISSHYGDLAELKNADQIVSLTFLVIVGTVTFYGLAAAPLARFLGLAVKNHQGVLFAGGSPWVLPLAKAIYEEDIPVLVVDTNFRHVSEARMLGLPSSCASVVSDYMEETDLGGIGRLLAVTPNDDLNTLAAMEYAPLFGRGEVYQLPFREIVAGRRETSAHNRGRYLFGQDATHSKLSFRVAMGAQVKKTKITKEFTYEDFLKLYGDTTVLMGVLADNKQLSLATANTELQPKPGQTVIALVDPRDGEAN
ncbi:MAG: sodium:proton antiporter [Pirellulaceae bacterium]|nr:sodium:proton antiporter [Pirellulaceae bacterium]